jgi:hypothetical protein
MPTLFAAKLAQELDELFVIIRFRHDTELLLQKYRFERAERSRGQQKVKGGGSREECHLLLADAQISRNARKRKENG